MAATTYRAFVTLAPKSVVVAATINGAFYFLLPSLDRFLARSYRKTTPADVFIGHTLLHCITAVNYRANEGCGGAENTNVHCAHGKLANNVSTGGIFKLSLYTSNLDRQTNKTQYTEVPR